VPDIEWQALCRTVQDRDFDALARARITTAFFLDPENAAVFDWIREHWSKYGSSPSEDAFRREYGDTLIETPEPLAYYIDELRDQRRYALLLDTLDAIKEPLDNQDTEIAVKLLATGLEGLHQEVTELLDTDMVDNLEEQMAAYRQLATNPGIAGWPTGFPSMDKATWGLQKSQLVTLVGLQKVKKSMLLMCMNIAAHNAGATTMFISFEMTDQEQRTRHDALRAGISLTHLQHPAAMEDWEWKKLSRMMHTVEGMQHMWLIHDPGRTTTVSAIAAKIALHRPDVVFIDGTYLMDSEEDVPQGSPQALTSITRALKQLASRTEIPIVQTTQALSWKAKRGVLSLDSIGYSSSFAQDSDVIFGVEEVKEDGQPKPNDLVLRIIASRNCPVHNVMLLVDLDHGSIMETEEIEYDQDDDMTDTR
jgi:replicative DNA helicase